MSLEKAESEKSIDSGKYLIDPETIAKWTDEVCPQEGSEDQLAMVMESIQALL